MISFYGTELKAFWMSKKITATHYLLVCHIFILAAYYIMVIFFLPVDVPYASASPLFVQCLSSNGDISSGPILFQMHRPDTKVI